MDKQQTKTTDQQATNASLAALAAACSGSGTARTRPRQTSTA